MKFFKVNCNCKAVLSTAGLIFGYFLFLLFGGFMFLLIEKENDENLKNARRNTFLSVLAKHNISVNNTVIKEIVTAAVSASEVNGLSLKDYAMATLSDWNLGSSVFFAGTIVTTIGYGNIHPRTTWGKAFCIIFATVGIPFTGVVLGKMGLGLTNLIKTADAFIENRIKQCFPKASQKDNIKSHVRSIQLGFVVIMFVLIFLLVPAGIMTRTEKQWEFFDAFYFCFVSLSTIGLGDLTPGASENGIEFTAQFQWKTVETSLHQLSVILYLLTGLAALSIILALVGSIMKSAAEKTLKGGTDLMSGGKAIMGEGGKQLVGGARRFASSMRQKAATAMNIGRPTSIDSDEGGSSFNESSSPEKKPMTGGQGTENHALDEIASERGNFEAEVDSERGNYETEVDGHQDIDAHICDSPSHEMSTSQTVLSHSVVLNDRMGSGGYRNRGLNDRSNSPVANANGHSIFYVVPKRTSSGNLPTAEG